MMPPSMFRPNTSRMTMDQRSKLNGGFIAGPGNLASNRMIEDRMMKGEDKAGGKDMPPNLRDVGTEEDMCGNCKNWDEEGMMCMLHKYPTKYSNVCDDHERSADALMGAEESGEMMPDSESDEEAY